MSLIHLLNAVRKRAPWLAVGRPILKAAGFEITRGSQPTLEAALQAPNDPVRNAKLADYLTEHAVVGEKLVRLIAISPAERTRLLQWIRSKRRASNDLSVPFPGVALDSQLAPFALQDPTSLGTAALQSGYAALYSAVRSYQERVELNVNKLLPGVNDGFEELYATKRVFWQTFDSIWLPPGINYVCLIADLPAGVPSGFARDSQIYLAAQLRGALGRSIVALNLWNAIDGLYQARSEGRLVDHGFVNNDEAVKSHTSRRGGRQSLRDDPYDVAGAAAVGDALLTYRAAIAWPRPASQGISGQPEALLPGTARLLHTSKLDHFVARNCITSGDLAFVVSRILAHI